MSDTEGDQPDAEAAEEPVQAVTIPRAGGGTLSPEALKTLAELGASLEDAPDDDQKAPEE